MLTINDPCDTIRPLEECLQLNRQLKLLLDSSSSIYVLLDDKVNFLYGSSVFLQLLGLEDFSSLLGKRISNVYEFLRDDALVQRNQKRFARLMSGEDMIVEDEVLDWPMAGKRSYRIIFRRIPGPDGTPDRILIVLNDVTEVRIQEAEFRLNELLNSSQLPTLVWDDRGNVVACNKEACRIFNFPDHLTPDKYNEMMIATHPEYQSDGMKTENVRQSFLREVLDKGFARAEVQLKKADGTPFYFGVTGARITWHSGSRLVVYYADMTAIKNKEEEVREAEKHMSLMLEATPLCCHLFDRDNNVIDCSQEALNLFGVPDKQTYMNNFLSFSPEHQPNGELSSALVKKTFQEVFEKDGRKVIEWMHCNVKGEMIPTEVTLTRVKYKDSYVVTSYTRDLREMKRMQKETDEANELFRIMLDSMPMTSVIFDENLNVVECNEGALKLFSLPDKQTLLKNFYNFSPEQQPDGRLSKVAAKAYIQDAFEKGGASFHWIHQCQNGHLIPMEVTLVRVKHKEQNHVVGYASDLRDIVLMAQEADDANERVKLMLDSTPLICILRDEHNNIIDCNQETLNIFGITRKADFIKDFIKFDPEFQSDGSRSVDKIQELMQSVLVKGKIHYSWTFQLSNGELLPVDTTLVRIPWKDTYSILSYSRDLREAMANEQRMKDSVEQYRKLEVQKEKALAASEAKSLFLASMSHEIRTPMNTIIGLLDLMRTDNLDEKQKQYIRDVSNMSHVLLEIINDVLDFHKIEEGKFELNPIHFNINTLYNNLVSQYKFLAETKQLTFTSRLAPDLPRCLFGDALRINQIVTNLMSNAIKYTQKGYVNFNVDTVVEDGDEFVAFAVEDSGVGIEEENFATLFDRFEQFDRRKNQGIPGTGLGLSIAKNLANMMGGYIRFQSEYCKGSVFTLLLPLIEGDQTQIERVKDIERVIARPDVRVLVVDDNPGNITVAVGLLARHGIVPQTAFNGLQAIEMVKNNTYDLVFMDHMMPEMDGVQATTIIRGFPGEYFENLPIIALSANAITGAKKMFLECGMNDFISKPILGNELNLILSRWLPKNKTVDTEHESKTKEPFQYDFLMNELLHELTKIHDLSIASGLSRVGGDKKLYLNVLRQFCRGIDDDIHTLKTSVKDGQWKAYTIRIHAVKSILATIGNKYLSEWAFRLEKAATNSDTNKCIKENRNFCTALSKFHAKLLQTDIMVEVATVVKKHKVTHRYLRKKLESLRTACDDFNPETAEPMMKELRYMTLDAPMALSTAVNASLTEINNMVHSYDYDKAVDSIEKLIKML